MVHSFCKEIGIQVATTLAHPCSDIDLAHSDDSYLSRQLIHREKEGFPSIAEHKESGGGEDNL